MINWIKKLVTGKSKFEKGNGEVESDLESEEEQEDCPDEKGCTEVEALEAENEIFRVAREQSATLNPFKTSTQSLKMRLDKLLEEEEKKNERHAAG